VSALPSNAGEAAEQAAWLARNAVDCLPEGELARKLQSGRRLRVKLGIDPTAPDIHLGFTVVLQKLREFQDLGHTVVLIVGDYTARVGDPSGRSSTRPVLEPEQIDANARTFERQAMTVLRADPELLEVRFNGEWLDMAMSELFVLMRSATVGQILERDDFAKRYASHQPISMLELLYPLLQGYDSVAVRADVELGGADQKFNLLLGRVIQRAYGVPEQAILTLPLLTGTDGERKMSKSYGNYIGVTDSADEIYGKTLSIPDRSLPDWYALLLDSSPDPGLAPRDAKRALARALVERFHDAAAATEAEARFDRIHVRRELPDDIPEVVWAGDGGVIHLPALIALAWGISTSEARRGLGQGAVRIDGAPVADGALELPVAELDGRVLQFGKRRFARVRVAQG
jgi:tyrosyl-tRNA synthetase